MGLPYYIKRSIEVAEKDSNNIIVFEVDTFGGRVDAATQIKDAILATKLKTIAFINRRAISAGALISLSCDKIYMTNGATIGAATAVDLNGNKASEKVISYMREEMASTAQAHNRSREIAEAMVDEQLEIDFFITSSGDTLTSKEVKGFLKNKLITLSTKEALSIGMIDGIVSDWDSLLLKLENNKNNLIKIDQNWSEALVRFLTNPVFAPILMSLGMFGLIFEVKSPGFGVPGIAGLFCLSLFFGAHLLVGLANQMELIMICVGIIFIVLEVIIIPGSGFVGIPGFLFILFGLYKMLLGEYPTNYEIKFAYYSLICTFVAGLFLVYFLMKKIVKTSFYKKIIPMGNQKSSNGYSISRGYEKLVSMEGIAITDLKPSGNIKINNQKYQAMSEGSYIDKNSIIEVIDIHENQLIVKKNN